MAPNQFANLLKRERRRRGWTQKYVAIKLKTTRVTVARWEAGTALPAPYLRDQLSKLLGTSIQEYFPVETPGPSSARSSTKQADAQQKLSANEEVSRLEAENHHLDMQIKLLEIQTQHVKFTLELANQFINILDPLCSAEVRSLTIKQLLDEPPDAFQYR